MFFVCFVLFVWSLEDNFVFWYVYWEVNQIKIMVQLEFVKMIKIIYELDKWEFCKLVFEMLSNNVLRQFDIERE